MSDVSEVSVFYYGDKVFIKKYWSFKSSSDTKEP